MSNPRITIAIYSQKDGDEVVSFETLTGCSMAQIRNAAQKLKAIAPSYVDIKIEWHEEIKAV